MALGLRLDGPLIDAAELLGILQTTDDPVTRNPSLALTNSQCGIMEQAVNIVVNNNNTNQQQVQFKLEENANDPLHHHPQHHDPHHHQPQQQLPTLNINTNSGFYRDHWIQTPCLDDLDTDFKFEVQVPMDDKEKKQWYYDPEEKLLFVKGEQLLTAIVSYKPKNTPLFLRLMPVYTSLADVHSPVIRCPNHKEKCKSGHNHHLVHSPNEGCLYSGEETGSNFSDRMSLLIPMHKSHNHLRVYQDHEQVKEDVCFSIMCLNSCSGISRRSTAIIFTLETADCQIVGRTVMNFKSCTSPKRDFDHRKRKRGDEAESQPSAKRPMIVKNLDGTVTTVKKEGGLQSSQESNEPMESASGETQINVLMPNKKYALTILKLAQDFLSGEVTRGHRVNKKYFKILGKQIEETTRDLKK